MTSLKSRRLFTLAAVVLVVTLAGVSVAQDPPGVAGIWTHGDTVLLFAFFGTCGDENVDFEQTLISRDGGKTWAKTGPRLYGQRLMFLLPEQGSGTSKGTGEDRNASMADELWLASEWSIESPGDPNLMLFDANSADWPHFEIDKEGGIAALVAIARDELDSTGSWRGWSGMRTSLSRMKGSTPTQTLFISMRVGMEAVRGIAWSG